MITRREFLGATATVALAEDRPKPNILYILADDLGYGDVQRLNPKRGKILTPNFDRLSRQSVTFTDAHSGAAVCTPTRYGILTGRYAWRSRLQSGVLQVYGETLIASDRLTVPKMLRANGYHTACIGKWHLGWHWPKVDGKPVFDRPITGGPGAAGFDYSFGVDLPHFPPYCFIENGRTVGLPTIQKPDEMFGTPGPMLPGWTLEGVLPALADKAGEYIKKQAAAKSPFFLYLPLTAPHTPLAIAPEWRGKSGRLGMYGDWVMQTDFAVGQVLQALDESGAAGNTLVIFASDNGCAPYVGVTGQTVVGRVHELEREGHFPSAYFRGYKADIWEGGHRIPFFARWPGRIKPDSYCDHTICLGDLMATCAEMLDLKIPANAAEDSVSILPSLLGGRKQPRDAVVHHSVNGRFAIRQGEWKLACCPASGGYLEAKEAKAPAVQLYNMSRDPRETTNLQSKEPKIVKRMLGVLEDYIAQGRSTPGARQENDVPVDIWKDQPRPETAVLHRPRASFCSLTPDNQRLQSIEALERDCDW